MPSFRGAIAPGSQMRSHWTLVLGLWLLICSRISPLSCSAPDAVNLPEEESEQNETELLNIFTIPPLDETFPTGDKHEIPPLSDNPPDTTEEAIPEGIIEEQTIAEQSAVFSPTNENNVISEEVIPPSEIDASVSYSVPPVELPSEGLPFPEDESKSSIENLVEPPINDLEEAPPETGNDLGSNKTGKGSNVTGEVEDEIPSFQEWVQSVYAEEEKSGAEATATVASSIKISAASKLRQKNYASPDCGAKILASNPDADNAVNVLNPSRDEYLLSTCTSKTWFVVELCEAIQAQKIEIANYELFSSSPKDFRVYICDRYPTREWALLGQFTAADERSIQGFLLEQKLFGKFVKVEVDNHYGTEHFCPISLFRVFGNSEYEIIDSDSRSDSVEDSTEEEMLDSRNVGKEGVPSMIKTTVMNIIKKTAEILSKGSNSNAEASTNDTAKVNATVCHTSVNPSNVTKAVNDSLSCQWDTLNFLVALPWLQSSTSSQCSEKNQSFYAAELQFAKSIWGESTVKALCLWSSPDEPLLPVASLPVEADNSSGLEEPPVVVESIFGPMNELELQQLDSMLSEVPGEGELPPIDATPVVVEEKPTSEPPIVDVNANPKVEEPVKSANPPSPPPPTTPTPPLTPGSTATVQQKESVFLRLSNRIKMLERNSSLSNMYLEELSRRYKRQVDDMQKALNRTMQTLNETIQRMSAQEEKFAVSITFLHGEIDELRSSNRNLNEENLVLRTQVIERHIFLMIVEVAVVVAVVSFLLKRLNRPTPPPSPEPSPTIERNPVLDLRLQVGHTVEDLNIVQKDLIHKPSPAPSLADSTSSGCESAFSFHNSTRGGASRDPSPSGTVDETDSVRSVQSGKKKKKKNKSGKSSPYHTIDSKSSPPSPSKVRLKSDNWEWHSRAKILAAEFIKDNYGINGLRSSM